MIFYALHPTNGLGVTARQIQRALAGTSVLRGGAVWAYMLVTQRARDQLPEPRVR